MPVRRQTESRGECPKAGILSECAELRNPEVRDESRHGHCALSIKIIERVIAYKVGEVEVREYDRPMHEESRKRRGSDDLRAALGKKLTHGSKSFIFHGRLRKSPEHGPYQGLKFRRTPVR